MEAMLEAMGQLVHDMSRIAVEQLNAGDDWDPAAYSSSSVLVESAKAAETAAALILGFLLVRTALSVQSCFR